jgi:hypothetical protein
MGQWPSGFFFPQFCGFESLASFSIFIIFFSKKIYLKKLKRKNQYFLSP